jgi:hypothetical protein
MARLAAQDSKAARIRHAPKKQLDGSKNPVRIGV